MGNDGVDFEKGQTTCVSLFFFFPLLIPWFVYYVTWEFCQASSVMIQFTLFRDWKISHFLGDFEYSCSKFQYITP